MLSGVTPGGRSTGRRSQPRRPGAASPWEIRGKEPVMTFDMKAETITITGHDGAEIEAYLAQPLGGRAVRRGRRHPPHARLRRRDQGDHPPLRGERLHGALPEPATAARAPGCSPDDAAAAARAKGGVPDERLVGDVAAAATAPPVAARRPTARSAPSAIAPVAASRSWPRAACRCDAAVDCYGAFVIGTPPDGFPMKVTPLVDRAKDLSCPLLGLFGAEDQFPSPEQVAELEEAAEGRQARTYEFHYLRGRRPRVLRRRPPRLPPRSGDRRVGARSAAFFGRLPREAGHVHLPDRAGDRAGQREGRGRVVPADRRPRVYFDHPVHAPADHTLNVDFLNPGRGPGARVAVELDPASARALAEAILATLDAAPAALIG